jgi:hypothetical protein
MHDMNNTGPQNGVSLLVTVVTLIIFTLIPVEYITHRQNYNLWGGKQFGRSVQISRKEKLAYYIFRIGT